MLYTYLVKTGIITLEKLIELMAINPRKRFGLPPTEDFCVIDTSKEFAVDPNEFLSKGRSTPFKGMKLYGRVLMTVKDKKIVYRENI